MKCLFNELFDIGVAEVEIGLEFVTLAESEESDAAILNKISLLDIVDDDVDEDEYSVEYNVLPDL